MAQYDSYMICTSPRSGSTLLCKMLAATGAAGLPESYFFGTSLEDWMDELGILPNDTVKEPEMLKTVFETAQHKGCNGTGVFGLRMQMHSFGFFCDKLATLHPGYLTDCERIERAFGRTLFVHLARADKVRQAVSYLKAQQTGLWHMAPDGSELERLAPHRAPRYDGNELKACVETMIAYDRGWDDWFTRERINPVRVAYDDLSANPIGTLRNILEQLGLDCAAADGVAPGVKKLADSTSQEWVMRFHAEGEHEAER